MGCCGGDDSGDSASKVMRKEQERKEGDIRRGMAQLDAIYGGGSYVPWQPLFRLFGQDFSDEAFRLCGNSHNADEAQFRMCGKSSDTERVVHPGFTDAFYAKRKGEYEGYALPQLAKEYEQTRQNMIYDLANKGLLNSSAAETTTMSLGNEVAKRKREIGDAAVNYEQQLRKQVADEKAAMVAQLYATADPASASQAALASASRLQMPSAFEPVGNFLTDWTAMNLAKKQYEQAQAGSGWPSPRMSLGFMPSSTYRIGK
jgi:hypothetical protein